MSLDPLTLVRVLEGLRVIVGVIIVYYALAAYMRGKSRSMISLTVAFVLLTVAGITENVMFDVFQFNIRESQAARSLVAVVGLIFVLYAVLSLSPARTKIGSNSK